MQHRIHCRESSDWQELGKFAVISSYTSLRAVLWIIVFPCAATVSPAQTPATTDFERAEVLLPASAAVLALNEDPHVGWSEDARSLWYRQETAAGHEYVRIWLPTGERQPLFNHRRLADGLAKASASTITPTDLPLDENSFDLGAGTVEATVENVRFRCAWEKGVCAAVQPNIPSETASRSPDKRFDLVRDGFDLRLDDLSAGRSIALTKDGVADRYYGANVFLERDDALGLPHELPAVWSPDSRWAATLRLNVQGVGRMSILRTSPRGEDPRPRADSYRFPVLGDPISPMAELVLVDVRRGTARVVESEPWPLPSGAPFGENPRSSLGWWSAVGARFTWLQVGRGNHAVSLWTVDAKDGKARKILEESSRTRVGPQQGFIDPRNTSTYPESHEVLWFSERDGWGHLYVHDARSGGLKRRLTEGEWLVREVVYVDAGGRTVYFTAGGREPGRNPYFRHLYRTSLDSSEVELLTAENADHAVEFSPDGRYFIDTFSRVDSAPRTVIRTRDGKLVADIETAELRDLFDAGWRFPEPFVTLAADGVTPIYGALFYPRDFDPDRKYPVIDDIFPLTRSPARFTLDAAQALADLGFVVVTLDARGATGRSKAFHDAGYGLMGGRLEDHVAALRNLGADRPALDLDRVGVIGHSWGGAAAARALLTFPEFFLVAVCSSGVHDLRIAQAWFSESVVGLSDPESEEATNLKLAGRLKGRLLLAHGGADYWTHPAHTLRLAQRLLQAGKDFDLILLPDREHNVPSSTHFRRKSWEYFRRHLGPPVRR